MEINSPLKLQIGFHNSSKLPIIGSVGGPDIPIFESSCDHLNQDHKMSKGTAEKINVNKTNIFA